MNEAAAPEIELAERIREVAAAAVAAGYARRWQLLLPVAVIVTVML